MEKNLDILLQFTPACFLITLTTAEGQYTIRSFAADAVELIGRQRVGDTCSHSYSYLLERPIIPLLAPGNTCVIRQTTRPTFTPFTWQDAV